MEPCSQLALNGNIYVFGVNLEKAVVTCQVFRLKRTDAASTVELEQAQSFTSTLQCDSQGLAGREAKLYARSLISPLCFIATPCLLITLKSRGRDAKSRNVLLAIHPVDEKLRTIADFESKPVHVVHSMMDGFKIHLSVDNCGKKEPLQWHFGKGLREYILDDSKNDGSPIALGDSRLQRTLRKIGVASGALAQVLRGMQSHS